MKYIHAHTLPEFESMLPITGAICGLSSSSKTTPLADHTDNTCATHVTFKRPYEHHKTFNVFICSALMIHSGQSLKSII